MHKNPAWMIFLGFIGLTTLYFCASAAVSLYDYYYETQTAVPLSINWSYRKVSNDVYAPFASYTFQVKGGVIKGESFLAQPLFRNEWVADEILNSLKKDPHKIWYDPSHPHRSTMEKTFPIRDCVYALVLVILFGYFIGLGIYVGRYGNN